MSETNYEALGRYTAAKEQADALAEERHNIAAAIIRFMHGASLFPGISYPSEVVRRFPAAEVAKRMEQLTQVNVRLEAIVQEANVYASEVGKPLIKIIPP